MLQNAYLDAKIGFDTEENEPPQVWSELFIIHDSLFIRLLKYHARPGLRRHAQSLASSLSEVWQAHLAEVVHLENKVES